MGTIREPQFTPQFLVFDNLFNMLYFELAAIAVFTHVIDELTQFH
jgi:hypothetical protein